MDSLTMIGAASVATVLVLRGRRRPRRLLVVPDEPIVQDEPIVDAASKDPLLRIYELLEEHVSPTPKESSLYQIVRGDTVETVARAVLDGMGGTWTEQMLLDYIHCMSSGNYNLGRYGTPSTTKTFPKKFLAPGIQRGIRIAFMPRNQDALAMLRVGIMPKMVVDPRTGAPRGEPEDTFYGLIWLPPIDPSDFAVGIISCAPFQWEDGSSTIDPDPELMSLAA